MRKKTEKESPTKKELPTFSFEDLKAVGDNGKPFAHTLVRFMRRTFDEVEILKIADENGWSTAHEQADMGYRFASRTVLTLRDNRGVTVAHVMASRGYVFQGDYINNLVDNDGRRVKDVKKILPKSKIQKPLLGNK